MNERVMGHSRYLCVVMTLHLGTSAKHADLIPPPKSAKDMVAVQVRLLRHYAMSALGQKQTCALQHLMPALPPKADIRGARGHARLIPESGHRAAPNPWLLRVGP